jgi:hypothetical protein
MVIFLGLTNPRFGPAGTISFNPSLNFAQSYTSNVLFTSENEISDTFTTIGLTFPVIRTTKKSKAQFIYSPAYQIYSSADQLDNLSHQLSLQVRSQPGRSAKTDLSVLYSYGQDQGAADSTNAADFTLIPRSTREQGRISLGFENQISGRWGWGALAYYETLSYSSIRDSDSDLDPVLPRDRTAVGAVGRITRSLSALASVGFEVEVDQFDIISTGKEDLLQLSFLYRKTASRGSKFNLRVGAFRSTLEPLIPLPPEINNTQTDFQGDFSYDREIRSFRFDVRGSHSPTFGYGRAGTSTDTYLGVSLNKDLTRRLDGGLTARWARSAPRVEGLATVDSVAVGGGLGLQAHPTLSLRFGANLVDQIGNDDSLADSALRDVAVLEAYFTLVWSPLARKPIAQIAAGGGP